MTPDELDQAWAARVLRLISRLRKRGVPEEELLPLELELMRIVAGSAEKRAA